MKKRNGKAEGYYVVGRRHMMYVVRYGLPLPSEQSAACGSTNFSSSSSLCTFSLLQTRKTSKGFFSYYYYHYCCCCCSPQNAVFYPEPPPPLLFSPSLSLSLSIHLLSPCFSSSFSLSSFLLFSPFRPPRRLHWTCRIVEQLS